MKEILLFHAPHCSMCEVMIPRVEEICKEKNIKLTLFDISEDNIIALLDKYPIRACPTFIVLEDGNITNQFNGVRTKEAFIKEMDENTNIQIDTKCQNCKVK